MTEHPGVNPDLIDSYTAGYGLNRRDAIERRRPGSAGGGSPWEPMGKAKG